MEARNETDRQLCVLIWVLFVVFLFFSMCFVFISADDDYGQASLSLYVGVEPNVSGQDFTFSQLTNYLYRIYHNHGGRVVFLGAMILMLKNVWIIRIIQVAAIFVSFFALHRLSAWGKGNAKTVLL
ncbi:MAG: hypothetical protein LBI54_02235, partial [Lachnospiraceae bacterium]|nr:hypothetical protein [Lachnospiraceae bacterium]